jgi:two-component system invasion response regulator UvrY
MRVLIIEDHRLLREGLIGCLTRHYVDWVFGEAESVQDAKLQLQNPWDVVLLDLLLPDGSGFDLLSYIKSSHPQTKVIVVTCTAEQDYGIATLSEGAAAFITKQASYSEVVRAIDLALAGRRYLSQSMVEQVRGIRTRFRNGDAFLSTRELDIVHFVGQGFAASQIAVALNLSPRTVETYRSRICRKLALKGKAGLIRYAVAREMNPWASARARRKETTKSVPVEPLRPELSRTTSTS